MLRGGDLKRTLQYPDPAVPRQCSDSLLIPIVLLVLLFLIPWCFIPAGVAALNAFDPTKRLLWAVLLMFVSFGVVFQPVSLALPRRLCMFFLFLLAWMGLGLLREGSLSADLEPLAIWLLPLIIGFGACMVSRQISPQRLGGILLFSAGAHMLLMLLQRAGLDPLFGHVTRGMPAPGSRMLGTIGYHNQALDFVAVSFAGLFLCFQGFRWRLGGLILLLFFSILTGNRTGVIALLFSGGLVLSLQLWYQLPPASPMRLRRLILALSLTLLTTLSGMWFFQGTAIRFQELLRPDTPSHSLNSRLWMYRVATEMIQERPWRGWGPGAYPRQYPERLAQILPAEKDHALLQGIAYAREAHSDPLQFIAEFGIIGGLLFLVLFFTILVEYQRRFKKHADTVYAGLFVFMYMTVASLFSFSWQYAVAGPLAGCLIGYCLGCISANDEGKRIRLPIWTRMGFLAISSALLGVTGFHAFLNIRIPQAATLHDIRKLSERLPRNAGHYHAVLGGLAASHGDFQLAETLLEQARPTYEDTRLWETLAYVYATQNDWTRSRDIYAFWLETGLEHHTALQNLSVAEERLGHYGSAADLLQERVRMWPPWNHENSQRYILLRLKAGEDQKAWTFIQARRAHWVVLPPHHQAELYGLSGGVALSMGHITEAEALLNEALRLNPVLQSAQRNLLLLRAIQTRP